MHKPDDEIVTLITGRIHGELSDEENDRLDRWLAESERHIGIFREYETLRARTQQVYRGFDPEVEPALNKLKSRGQKRRLYLVRWAAAVVLPAALIWAVLYRSDRPGPELRDFAAIARPGREIAILKQAGTAHVIPEQSAGDRLSFSSAVVQFSEQNYILNYSDTTGRLSEEVVADLRDELSVPRGGEFQVILADGTKVWLNASTTLKYPRRFSGGERRVQLTGEAYFEVSHHPEKPFIVETPAMDIRVLGTAFNVNAYEGEETVHTTLVNGKVDVCYRGGVPVGLQPGEQLLVVNDSLIRKEVNLRHFTSWKEGRFLFENTTLEEIARQISRWYDVEVIFMSEPLKQLCFTGGMIRFKPLEELIGMIETTSQVRFGVKEKTIVISGY